MGKTLVAYFSASGTTEEVARTVADVTKVTFTRSYLKRGTARPT